MEQIPRIMLAIPSPFPGLLTVLGNELSCWLAVFGIGGGAGVEGAGTIILALQAGHSISCPSNSSGISRFWLQV